MKPVTAALGLAFLMVAVLFAIPAGPARAADPNGPNACGQAGVPLGAAAGFGVLAGSTVTSTGMTTVTGDLGVSPGTAVTGFPPGIVVGAIHAGDPAAAAAIASLTTAYNDAAGRTLCPITVAGNIGGQTLAPGLYKSTSSLAVSSGDLTLDGGGDGNAVWIFQIASTLTTTSGRQVILAGGARASNVYWQVGSSATIGTTSVFVGTMMADQSITFTTGATLEGRALARIAAVTLDGNEVTKPAPATDGGVGGVDLSGERGGNFRMAVLSAPSWNPASTNPTDAPVHNLVWDTLARPDPVTSEPKPWAALGWTPDSAAKTITVSIRSGLRWSAGGAITNADLVRTFTQYGFTVTASGSNLVFNFTAGEPGRFYSEVLYDWIAWDSVGTLGYSGMFAPTPGNTNLLATNTHYWAGPPKLDSVTLVVASSVDDAACRLLKNRALPTPPAGTVDFIGFGLLPNDLTDERACTAYGGFLDGLGNPLNKSLVNANASRAEPSVSAVHNPGPRFMYYWLNVAGGGAMGDVNFRRGLYLLVNKQLAVQIEPSSKVTHSLISRDDQFWFMPTWEVIRDAGFTTIRDPLGTPRQDTNPFLGAQALDMAGYLDRDGDGWRQTPTGAAFSINVGVVGFSVDPRKTTIVGAYIDVLRRQGVNANLITYNSWTDLRAAEASGALQVALETYDPGTSNPRWMETFQPIIDANDPSTVTHLGLGKNSYTLAERRLHYNHVPYYNSLCACVPPVVHYETLEAFDRYSFSGWVERFGGINNVWSFGGLRLPAVGTLFVSITPFTRSVTSGGSTTIQIVVSDASGAAVPGASVVMTQTAGYVTPSSGVTDASGRFQPTWTAPTVTQDMDATVTAIVGKAGYVGAVVSTGLTTHAPFRPLDILVVVQTPTLGAGNTTTVTVTVTSLGAFVPDADVSLSISLPGGQLNPSTGRTGSNGVFTATFTANPSVRSIYRIDVTASKPGYAPGAGAGSVIVTPAPNDPDKFTRVTTIIPGFETIAVLGAIGAAVVILRVRSRTRREG